MRIVTKQELLKLPPYTMFREWVPTSWNYYDWDIKTGQTFGAFEFSPSPEGRDDEDLEPVYDWDGQLDYEDNQLFAVLEKKDIELMQKRLALIIEKGGFDAISNAGKETWEI